jgi:hypothetical protein
MAEWQPPIPGDGGLRLIRQWALGELVNVNDLIEALRTNADYMEKNHKHREIMTLPPKGREEIVEEAIKSLSRLYGMHK